MPNQNSQPTYKRQRFLLSLVKQLQDDAYPTDIQKLVFLYEQENKINHYEFVPYKFGPYSFQLAEDIDSLCKDGYLIKHHTGIKAAGDYQYDLFSSLPTERGDALKRRAYRKYPYYAINSDIIDRLFRGEEAEFFHNYRNQYRQEEQVLFTIGYEGISVEEFFNTLIQNDIRLLIDVRRNPLSRKFGFSKERLELISKSVKIRYTHIPALGIESEKRAALNCVDDYKNLFQGYEETLDQRIGPLNEVYSLLCANTRIALMCFEKNAEMCHRHVIRDYLLRTYQVRSIDL